MFDSMPLVLAQENAPPTGGSMDSAPPSQSTGAATTPPAHEGGQTATQGTPEKPLPTTHDQSSPLTSYLPMIMIVAIVAMLWFSMQGQRKEKKRRAAMLSELKKGDKVVTIGGIIGSVVEVREDEVMVESANTRLKISRSAVNTIVPEDKA